MNREPPRTPLGFKILLACFALSLAANVALAFAMIPIKFGGGLAASSPDKKYEAMVQSLRDGNPLRRGEIFGQLQITEGDSEKRLIELNWKPAGVEIESAYRDDAQLEWSPDGKFLTVVIPNASIRVDVDRLHAFEAHRGASKP